MDFKRKRKMVHRGSALVFLAFSIVLFIIVYGVIFLLVPQILGQFFSVLDAMPIANPAWQAIYNKNEATAQFLVPLIPSMGIIILVIKVLMTASVKGGD